MNFGKFLQNLPVLSYYALTFVVSWGGILLAVSPGGFPGTPAEFQIRFPAALLALLSGPCLAGLLLTGIVEGRNGLRGLRSRLLRWRAGVRWSAIALLTAPFLFTAVPLALSLAAPGPLPGLFTADDKASLLALGVAAGLTTILEELGWTGFAVPRLRSSRSILATGLFAGLLWGLWHLPMNLWSSGTVAGTIAPDRGQRDPGAFRVRGAPRDLVASDGSGAPGRRRRCRRGQPRGVHSAAAPMPEAGRQRSAHAAGRVESRILSHISQIEIKNL